jgi:hypothetical protein
MTWVEQLVWTVLLAATLVGVAAGYSTLADRLSFNAMWANYLPLLAALVVVSRWRRIVHALGWWTRALVTRSRVSHTRKRWRWLFEIDEEMVDAGGQRLVVARRLTDAQRASLPKIAEALGIVEAVQPSRASRIKRLGIELGVAITPGAAVHISGTRVVLLDADFVASEAPAVLAGVLVHESNHVLLQSKGIPQHPWLTRRWEALADRDAMVFAVRAWNDGYHADAHRVKDFVVANEAAPTSFVSRVKAFIRVVKRQKASASAHDA